MRTIMDPTAVMFAGFIGAPTDVLTTEDITADTLVTIMGEDIIVPTLTGLIVGTFDGFIDVHIGGVITDPSPERPPDIRNRRAPCSGLQCSQGLPGLKSRPHGLALA
jgi:hypothetical protein